MLLDLQGKLLLLLAELLLLLTEQSLQLLRFSYRCAKAGELERS